MSFPDGITQENILDAAKAYDNETITHDFGRSTTYDVVINDNRYPPKAIVGLAAYYHTGYLLSHDDFGGGLNTMCFKVLEGNGFKIILKNDDVIELDDVIDPNEVSSSSVHTEGSTVQVLVNRYERKSKARDECIQYYGLRCQVCDFDFEEMFDEIGVGFIHVHHTVPLSEIKEEYVVDGIKDLKPVCPNCHAMLHKKRPIPYTIDELRKKLKKSIK